MEEVVLEKDWRIMDRGQTAPFYALFVPFFGRATNLPRANMSAGFLVVTPVTTRVVTCNYPRSDMSLSSYM